MPAPKTKVNVQQRCPRAQDLPESSKRIRVVWSTYQLENKMSCAKVGDMRIGRMQVEVAVAVSVSVAVAGPAEEDPPEAT